MTTKKEPSAIVGAGVINMLDVLPVTQSTVSKALNGKFCVIKRVQL